MPIELFDIHQTEKYVLEDMYVAVVNGRTNMLLDGENDEVFRKESLTLRHKLVFRPKKVFFSEKRGQINFLGLGRLKSQDQ